MTSGQGAVESHVLHQIRPKFISQQDRQTSAHGGRVAQVIAGLEAERLPGELRAAASRLQAAAHLEAAAQNHDVGHIADAQGHLEAAGHLLGIEVEVTGRLIVFRMRVA